MVKKNQKIKGKKVMFAALDLHEHKTYRKYLPDMSKENFYNFLKFLRGKFEEDVYIILDNHPTHRSRKAKQIFEDGRRLKSQWLPTHAPELNAVDSVFSRIQRKILNNRHFTSIEGVEKAIDRWIRRFNVMK
ncbi:MAG TPA: hypothetical protein EYP46_04520 [Hadesarchaea archaeon]|nr:hypothetical protein [Hadesarchaea archaeon]